MVTYVGGVYGMDGAVVSGRINDARPPILCDDARLQAPSSGGFQVEDAAADERLHELGLRDGDTPLELNGYPLDDLEDVAEVIELWQTDGEDTDDLHVLRGSTDITLDDHVSFT